MPLHFIDLSKSLTAVFNRIQHIKIVDLAILNVIWLCESEIQKRGYMKLAFTK